MLPFYVMLLASFAMPLLFLLEQLLLLVALQLLAFWCCHTWGLTFLAYALVLVQVGAIAILIVLTVLMMNLNRALTWHHAGQLGLFATLGGLGWQWTLPLPGYHWFAPSWLAHWRDGGMPRGLAEVWQLEMPLLTLLLAWLLCLVTLGIVQGVVNR